MCPNKIADYMFENEALFKQALTHKSAEVYPHYERLEFLGDRILNLCVAELLYGAYPKDQEGVLSKRHAALVRTETLAKVAVELGLDKHIVMSTGEEGTGGRSKPSILADVVEATIAAIYLDGGYQAASQFIQNYWEKRITEGELRDPKSHLQEYLQAEKEPLPTYAVLAEEGQDHSIMFTIEVNTTLGKATGTGPSKQAASQTAAKELLKKLNQLSE
ncbi:MAG: ribonuclease III [Alphaproteobacteria bacterium]|nr:ribonuclease III [Alphaproteobacteria bacterium]MDD9920382.1 ribonuclease III [Alphaproteobacteria bacterium]